MTAEKQTCEGKHNIPMGEDISPKKDGGVLKVICFVAVMYHYPYRSLIVGLICFVLCNIAQLILAVKVHCYHQSYFIFVFKPLSIIPKSVLVTLLTCTVTANRCVHNTNNYRMLLQILKK